MYTRIHNVSIMYTCKNKCVASYLMLRKDHPLTIKPYKILYGVNESFEVIDIKLKGLNIVMLILVENQNRNRQ